MTKEVIILCGNIGSGKSTIAKDYQKQGYIVIARDQLRYAIGGGNHIFNLKYEPIIWKTELYMLESFMELGVNIIVDGVGVSRSMRLCYIMSAKDYGYKIKCVLMPRLNMKEAVDRRMQNPHQQADRKLWEDVWIKFNRIYEEPDFKEGFDEIIRPVT